MSTFDMIALALLAIGGITGFQKGLITGIARLIGKIASIGIALIFHQPLLNIVEPTLSLEDKLRPIIGGFLIKIADNSILGGIQNGNSQALTQAAIDQTTLVLTEYVLKIGSILVLFIIAAIVFNLIITLIITPLAKNLSFVNRGGGFAFGILSTSVVLVLVVGFFVPFFTVTNPGFISNSVLYPWFIQGYHWLLSLISVFAGDFLSNPLESFPLFKGVAV